MRSTLAWVILGGMASAFGFVASASAQTCTADSGCPKGFNCEVTAVSGCATPVPLPAMRPACDGGSPCPTENPAPPPPQPTCAQKEYRSCVPGNCMTDGDCASGMVCHARSTGTCTSPAAMPCPPGSKCAAPVPVCTDTVEHVCVPRYVLPCKQASDCGPGFTCEAQQTCGCSGSAGAPTPASGPTPIDAGTQSFAPAPALPLPPPDCKCEPTGEHYCKVIETACRADSDCPSDFMCLQNAPEPTPVPACDPSAGKGDAGVCTADRGVMAPVYRCIPRYEYIDPENSVPQGIAPIPTSTPVRERPAKDLAVPPSGPATVADAGVSTDARSQHVRACSVSSPGANPRGLGIWALAGLLGLAAVVRRRTAR